MGFLLSGASGIITGVNGQMYVGGTARCSMEDNMPPNAPQQPDGPTGGIVFNRVVVGKSYTYTTVTTDPDGHDVAYMWDWGDDTVGEWSTTWPSGVGVSESHTWIEAGTYEVKVKAKDDPNGDGDISDGLESAWSEPLTVTVRNKIFDGSCFLAGTQIIMADESYKNIGDIEVGDMVKSYDVATGELGANGQFAQNNHQMGLF